MKPFVQDGEFKGSIESDTKNTSCSHSNARTTGDACAQGCCDWYLCPECGARFLVEVPD